MRSSFVGSFVLIVSSAACAGCTESPTFPGDPRVCTAVAVQSLNVTVLDAASGQRVCDATVVASEGAFQETLRSFGTEADCVYAGPTERAGVYEVRVSKAGYQPASVSNVRVGEDECHVIPVKLTISLSR